MEEFILSHLKDQLLSVENLKYIYDNVEKEVLRSPNEVLEELKQKRCQQEKIQAELQNLLNFIKAGNFSKVVSEAITDAEGRSQKVQDEIQGLELQRKSAFKAPPKEWIEHKLKNFVDTLNQSTKTSALALKDLLGMIEMEPISSACRVECGQLIQIRAYYVAYSKIDTLALLEETKGSNSLRYRGKEGPIRTVSRIPMQIKVPCHQTLPIHEALGSKVRELKVLGLSNRGIASRLHIQPNLSRQKRFGWI